MVIPEGWKKVKIKDITDVFAGGTPDTNVPEYWGGNIPWMNSGDLKFKFICKVDGRITSEGMDSSSTHFIPIGSVLVGLAGQGKTRGTVAYNKIELCTNQSIAAIYPNQLKFDSLYLYYFMDTQYALLRELSSGGGGRGGLNKNIILEYEIYLPIDISEQTAIATALSDMDDLIASLEKLLAKKQGIKQGAMQDLLTGRKRLKGFSGKLNVIRVSEFAQCLRGVAYNAATDLVLNESGETIKLLRANNVQDGQFVDRDVQVIKEECVRDYQIMQSNDILICMANGSRDLVGKNCILTELPVNTYTFGAFMGCIRCKEQHAVDAYYLFLILNSDMFYKNVSIALSGSSINNLKPSDIEDMQFLFPDIAEQRAIATLLSDMDDEITALQQKLAKYRQIKQGMMAELLTGRIRLKEA